MQKALHGGHDGQTANTFVCLGRSRRCVLLANDVRAEASFADLVRFVLGKPGLVGRGSGSFRLIESMRRHSPFGIAVAADTA